MRHIAGRHAIGTLGVGELADRLSDRARPLLWLVVAGELPASAIPGSRIVPLERLLATTRALGIARDTELVLYGKDGAGPEADLAAAKLADAGYVDVRILAGGLAAWHASRRPPAATDREALADPRTL